MLSPGFTQTPHISQIKIVLEADENNAQIQLKVFKAMALANISVDFINVLPGDDQLYRGAG